MARFRARRSSRSNYRKSNYKSKGNYKSKSKSKSKRTSFTKMIKDFAYKLGQVNRGLKNPDSQISASYNSGITEREKREKKPLF